ncbi:MAG: carbon monoxide dehydrogenase [Methanomicrobiales archaeon]|nr:carbon monoxide dehydrogenase [Methanomicrobiales archaeon]
MPNERSPCCTDPLDTRCASGYSCAASAGRDPILVTTSTITVADRWDHFLARWGFHRVGHRVEPGLYRLGNPTPDSEVFVSANYTLSFDALRSALVGLDAFILVLDTKGINVWCAAGKGTFGTEELVHRITATRLGEMVRHRRLILPQLSAPGVSWGDVLRRSGFLVEYGPVHARDLPAYLKTHTADPVIRRVQFPLRDRVVLIPVELVQAIPVTALTTVILGFAAGWVVAMQFLLAVLAGTAFFPILLPFLPTKDFTTKGLFLGLLVTLPFVLLIGYSSPDFSLYSTGWAIAGILIFPAITAFLSLNFTGSTPFTSRTGVRKEIFRYIPVLAVLGGSGIVLAILLSVARFAGVI